MKAVLCDDHQLFLESFAFVMRSRGHEVLETCCPEDAVRAVKATGPDVCVMDLDFRERGLRVESKGLDAMDAIRQLDGTTVVILTGAPDGGTHAYLRDSAVAVLEKGAALEHLLRSVEQAAAGVPLSERQPRGPKPPARWSDASVADFLTRREFEVLQGLAQGDSTVLLAARLGVRPATARTHVQKLLDKLGVHSRLEAVAFATRNRLLDLR